jgi:hypothetical protein
MKKLILAAITTACAASAFAQGTVVFNNAVSGIISTRVYGTNASSPSVGRIGNRTTDTPAGSTDYTGYTLVGTTGGMSGPGTFAQLLGASGFNAAESSLLPGLGVTSFRTGGASGVVTSTGATFSNIAPNAPAGTLEMVAWDNSSGLYPTWVQASTAWAQGLIAAGKSGTWNQDAFGGTQPAPNLINTTDPSQHVSTFNLYFQVVPEPTTAAMLGLGAAAMLIFRRRK